MAPNVGRGCFLCGSKDHNDCDMNLDELTILGEKIGLSGDALQAWLEEENAKEREAQREEAEREARARETELALAREVAALEERNSLLRIRLLEAQNAVRAHASVHVDNVSFMDRGASGRRSEFYEEASMPMEKYTDAHKELKNEARKGPEPEKSIASRDRMERSGSFGSDAPVQAGDMSQYAVQELLYNLLVPFLPF
ncbi:hypothetical protein HPB50_001860 [Hyalomma asiaticum]|uniref:Uncharacterized protein n=1 Tax=Hyalomma asiaticum TaxID=266040 RepID=A0ACB7SBM3_HYAAI|nr:hypothetical protein HPB50_001860 [Hyalomma asiaticum]